MRMYILFFIAYNMLYAQEQIKKIIYDDLLALNQLYSGCILQNTQTKMIFNDSISLGGLIPLDSISNDFNRVSVLSVETEGNFIHVKVKFLLLSGYGYPILFDENVFIYVLYKYHDYYYKINGFLVSEILLLGSHELLENVGKKARISKSARFAKHIKKRRIDKLRKYLNISIIKVMNNMGYVFNHEPYVKDTLSY